MIPVSSPRCRVTSENYIILLVVDSKVIVSGVHSIVPYCVSDLVLVHPCILVGPRALPYFCSIPRLVSIGASAFVANFVCFGREGRGGVGLAGWGEAGRDTICILSPYQRHEVQDRMGSEQRGNSHSGYQVQFVNFSLD